MNQLSAEKKFDEIECPKCGTPIPVSEALRHQLTQHIREELEEKVGQREKDILLKEKALKDKENRLGEEEKEVEKRVAKEVASAVSLREKDISVKEKDLKDKENQLAKEAQEVEKRIAQGVTSAVASREVELKKREDEIVIEKKDITKRIQEELAQERKKLAFEAKKHAEEAVSVEVKDMQERLRENEEKLEKAEQTELELRKRERELEQKEKNIELVTARRIATERQKVQEETAKSLEEEHRLKDAEKDKKLQDAIKVNEELRRKLQQGSQQTQGEVLELQIEELIRSSFPGDAIESVPKGINGADVVHRVYNRRGDPCGVIVWELKHTKTWIEGWVQKLKDDLRLVKGDVAVLVTETLPKGVENFSFVNGIWVTCAPCALGLAIALRGQLIEVATTRLSAVGKNEKMEILYQYLSGSEFRQRVEAIVESFVDMQKDLQAERRSSELRWSKREKQIQRVITNTAGMYGSLQGLIGTSSLQAIPALTTGEEQEEINEGAPSGQSAGSLFEQTDDINPDDIPF